MFNASVLKTIPTVVIVAWVLAMVWLSLLTLAMVAMAARQSVRDGDNAKRWESQVEINKQSAGISKMMLELLERQ